MLKYITFTTVGILFFITNSFGQLEFDKPLKPDSCVEAIDIFPNYEVNPEFPGGMDFFNCFVETQLDFEYINSIDTNGRAFYSFKIDTIGNLKFDSVFRSLNPELDLYMEGILNSSPQWTPGVIEGKKVEAPFIYILVLPYKRKCEK